MDVEALTEALDHIFTRYGTHESLTSRELAEAIAEEMTRVESLTMTTRISDRTFKVPPEGEPHA